MKDVFVKKSSMLLRNIVIPNKERMYVLEIKCEPFMESPPRTPYIPSDAPAMIIDGNKNKSSNAIRILTKEK